MSKSEPTKANKEVAEGSDGYPTLILIGAIVFCLIIFGATILHFFAGEDFYYISMKHVETAQYWGQLGDFAGGMLNPLLSFLALMAVLQTMKATQKETRIAYREQQRQTYVYSKQMFDSTFFGMLDAHSKLLENIRHHRVSGATGREAFELYIREFMHDQLFDQARRFPDDMDDGLVRDLVYKECGDHKKALSHYFRNIYWVLKIIDEQLESEHSSGSMSAYIQKRNYANILRAQFCQAELAMIQINCLGPYGAGLKYYVEKYSVLKPLGRKYFESLAKYMCAPFHAYAFTRSELIDISVIGLIKKKRRPD